MDGEISELSNNFLKSIYFKFFTILINQTYVLSVYNIPDIVLFNEHMNTIR